MPHNSWHLMDSQLVRDYKLLRLREDRYRFEPTGAEADFMVCESADWVLVIPITRDGRIVFVHQYRHAIREVVLEIPGGIMDDEESPQTTAARELQEETGYVSEQVEIVGQVLPNPALNTARCHFAIARECVHTGNTNPDPFERIDVVQRDIEEIPQMIRSGELSHALTITALALAGMEVLGQ